MNDYNELIGDLRDDYKAWGDGRAQNLFEVTLRCKQAADAIEQLVKERDEWMEYAKQERKRSIERYHELAVELDRVKKERDTAIADFTIYIKHMEDGRKAFSCEFCNEENCDGCKHCSNFEWRGVQEDNNETN